MVALLSSRHVFQQYQQFMLSTDELAPLHLLKHQGYRRVIVQSVLILSHTKLHQQQAAHNLAQVNFMVQYYAFGDSHPVRQVHFTALVSWQYLGVPKDPQDLLFDWDGFVVTRYHITALNAQ